MAGLAYINNFRFKFHHFRSLYFPPPIYLANGFQTLFRCSLRPRRFRPRLTGWFAELQGH